MKQLDSGKARELKRTRTPRLLKPAVATEDGGSVATLRARKAKPEIVKRKLHAAQAALDKTGERTDNRYDNAPVGLVTLDAQGVIRDANLLAAELFRVERGRLIGKPFSASLARAQSAAFSEYFKQVMAHDDTLTLDIRLRGVRGAPHDVQLIGVARYDTVTGQRLCHMALTDIQEEKAREETLRLHSLIMAHMIEGVVLVRASDGIILEVNPAFERMFGYGANELLGQHISMVVAVNGEPPQDTASRVANSLKHLGQWEGEIHHVRKDGSKFWTQATVTAFEHSVLGTVWVCVKRDLTERKRADQLNRERQNELAHVLRCNTVGELATTLAHELTQPVMAIEHFNHAAIGLAETDNGSREELLHLMRCLDQQVKRAGDVIRQMRRFVRRGVVDKKPTSLPHIIEETLVLLRPMFADRGVVVQVRADAALPPVNADAVQIEQVLVNLLRNGVEAMTVANSTSRDIEVSCEPHADHIEVIIHDHGPGLDPARERTLFDVFESQKTGGMGMGMGLAISRSIVQAHGGMLWADPATAGGATFHFTLPTL